MKANIQLRPGRWLHGVEVSPRAAGRFLHQLVRSDAVRMAAQLAKGALSPKLQLARAIFAPDPEENWYAPETALQRAERGEPLDCEDYARCCAALARVTGVDPDATAVVVEMPSTLHAVAKIQGHVVDVSGFLENGRGLTGERALGQMGRNWGLWSGLGRGR